MKAQSTTFMPYVHEQQKEWWQKILKPFRAQRLRERQRIEYRQRCLDLNAQLASTGFHEFILAAHLSANVRGLAPRDYAGALARFRALENAAVPDSATPEERERAAGLRSAGHCIVQCLERLRAGQSLAGIAPPAGQGLRLITPSSFRALMERLALPCQDLDRACAEAKKDLDCIEKRLEEIRRERQDPHALRAKPAVPVKRRRRV